MASHPPGPRYRSGNTPGKRATVNSTDLQAKRLEAVALRLSGMTYYDVAKKLGVTYETAQGYVKTILKQQAGDNVEQLRAVEDARIDKVVETAYGVMKKYPNTELALKAADRVLRAVALRAALHGLNAPVEVHVNEATQLSGEMRLLVQAQEQANEAVRSRVIEGEVVGADEAEVTG